MQLAAAMMVFAAGCEGDILEYTDDPIAVSDDGEPDGTIEETEFSGEVSIVWSNGEAAVTGAVGQFSTTVDGGAVCITYTGEDKIIYNLSGSCSDGSFKLYSDARQALKLDALSLTNPSGAAINIQSGHLAYVEVSGACSLSDGASATYTATGDEDCKGVLFSEGSLSFSGNGSLTVTARNARSKSAIVSDDHVSFGEGPSITVSAGSGAGHGVKANDFVLISGGTLAIDCAAAMKKGIASDGYVLVEGGEVTINVSGGVGSEDGEYKGSAGIKADNFFGMTGGEVTIVNKGNGGKGIRAGDYEYDEKNHTVADSYISGGVLRITTSGSEVSDVSAKGIKIGYKESATKAGGFPGGGGWGGGGSYVYAGNLKISGGNIYVSCSRSEAIEAKGDLTFDGGQTYAYSGGDDAINCQGEMTINGGYICGYSTGNDALDSNGNMKIYGGYVMAICTKGTPEVALDANTEGGYKLYIYKGATVVAYGGLESGYSSEQTVYTMSGVSGGSGYGSSAGGSTGSSAGGWNGLWNGSEFIAAFKAPAAVSSFAVCAPSLSTTCFKGVTVDGAESGTAGDATGSAASGILCNGCWAIDGISGGTEVTLTSYSGGGGFGPGGGGGGFPGGPGWH